MRILKKILNLRLLLVVSLFLTSVLLVFIIFWYAVVLPYYEQLEAREARYSATVVQLAFEREVAALEQLVIGYAAGHGSRADRTEVTPSWQTLFTRELLAENQLAAVVVLDLDAHSLFTQIADKNLNNISSFFSAQGANGWPETVRNYSSPVGGFFAGEQGWYLLAGTYLVSPSGAAQNHLHYLLFFRAVDEDFIYQLSRQYRFQFKLDYPLRADNPYLKQISRVTPIVLGNETDNYLNVYFKLEDVHHHKPALVNILFPREHIFQMRHSSLIHLVAIWSVFIVLAVILMAMVRCCVKKPFKELSTVIHGARKENKLRLPVDCFAGKEIASLVADFNLLLDDLEQSRVCRLCSEQKTDLIQRVVPSAIFTVNNDKVVTSWNDCATRLTGYKAEEMIGNFCFLFAEKPCQESCGLFDDMTAKPIMGRECTIRRKDGKFIRISKNVDYLKDDQGQIIGGIECFEDVSTRRASEEALQWELALNVRLAQLARSILHAPGSVEEIANELLDHARNLTTSPQGFVAVRHPNDQQSFLATTPLFTEQCVPEWEGAPPPRQSLLTCVYHYKSHVCFNDLDVLETLSLIDGVTEKVDHFMAVPIYDGDECLIGQLALANKTGGYTDHDRQAVEQLIELFAVVLIGQEH